MANNQYANKVIYGGDVIIDISTDDVTAADVLSGKKFHLPSGVPETGTCDYDADTSDATATAAEILATKTAYKNGSKLTGTMPNRGSATGTISTLNGQYTIQQGYHDGSITVLGVTGTMSGSEDVIAESPTVTPTTTSFTVTPSTGYNYLAQVTVNAIPYTEIDNPAGGKTVTIGQA